MPLEKPLDQQYSLPLEPMVSKETPKLDLHPESALDDDFSFFTNGMDHSISNSTPHIKNENEDSFLPYDYPSFGTNNMSNPFFGQSLGANVNPSDLTMPEGNPGQYQTGAPQNMSGSFNYGRSGIHDDELLDFDLNDTSGAHNFQQGQSYMPNQGHTSANGQGEFNQFSSTPDGAPIQSPFANANFNYAQFPSQIQPHQMQHNSLSMQNGKVHGRSSSYMAPGMDRQLSDSRSPMTPKTPGLNALQLGNGTPEPGSLPSQPIPSNLAQRHQNRLSGQMDNTPGSVSYLDSPRTSPVHAANHAQISDILKSGKHASLPAKVDGNLHGPGYQTQEAKRRRRRESHNLVERRRRDNINEKIQELSHLVPVHRLEDEKVRKHLMNNSPLSPTLTATGRSPEPATSLLAGGGRRAAGAPGSISIGIPPEEKDKGPNKGDILNGAVSWTRDLMWALHLKLQQENEIADYVTSLGGRWPLHGETEEEKRMKTELINAVNENDPHSFNYTRAPGTGLRVPEHTNTAGEPLDPGNMGSHSPQSLSPGQQSSTSGQHLYGQQWGQLKEEEEFMDM